ncbi:MAG: hypothetical protein ACE5FU_01755, partial [Nitrospinota bacterium]
SHKEERERFSLCQYSVGALNRQYPLFFLSLLGYLVWVFFGQNPDKVRHVIPVIPFLIVIVAPAVEIFEKRVWIVLLCISVSLLSNFVGRDSPVGPPEQFRRWILSENFSDATFFCGPTERYFDLYPVRQSVVSVPSVDELSGAINGSWPETKRNFVCDDIPGYAGEKKPVQVFPKRKGDPADISLKIYELL